MQCYIYETYFVIKNYFRDLSCQLPVSLSNPGVDLFTFEQLLKGFGQLHSTNMLPEGSTTPANLAKQLFSNICKVSSIVLNDLFSQLLSNKHSLCKT